MRQSQYMSLVLHIQSYTHMQKMHPVCRDTQSPGLNTFSVVLLCYSSIRILLPEWVTGTNAFIIVLFCLNATDMRMLLIVMFLVKHHSSSWTDFHFFCPHDFDEWQKAKSFRCTSHRLLMRQSHPDSSNEKMINRARD